MNNYAILRRAKLKTSKDLEDAYKHNLRIYEVANADPLREQDNIELIDTFGVSYEELVDQEVARMKSQGVPDRTIRKDAVKGFELIVSFSREQSQNIDIQTWAQKNLDWLDKTFNPPEHKATYIDTETGEVKTARTNNIKHAIVHMDESNPHMHVFVVPIDDTGHLNASFYDRGRYYLQNLQTECAEVNKEFGLVRGEMHSTATPEKISRYYNNILKAVDAELPEPLPDETALEYKTRADEVYQTALSNHRNEIVKMNQEIIHVRSQADSRIFQAKKEVGQEKEFFHQLLDAAEKYLPEQAQEEPEMERERTLVHAAIENLEFKEAVNHYPDQDSVQELMALYQQMLEWQRQREREEEKEKQAKEH